MHKINLFCISISAAFERLRQFACLASALVGFGTKCLRGEQRPLAAGQVQKCFALFPSKDGTAPKRRKLGY